MQVAHLKIKYNKTINTVAVIEVSKAIDAVEVHMRGYGCLHHYVEILKRATHFARLHGINHFLLIKEHFDDIDYQQFYQVIEKWLSFLDQHLSCMRIKKMKVAIVVERDVFLPLCSVIHKTEKTLPKVYEHLCFDLFYAYHKALGFLML